MDNQRILVTKTYKLYVDGKFPRTESGRTYVPGGEGSSLPNVCHCSRKDLRNTVVAARSAQSGWWKRSAYNRGQILYRIAEMLEGRAGQFEQELQLQGLSQNNSQQEVAQSIDRLIYYAGWADKYQQVFSCVNPVSTSHFNFSILEPMGVVFVAANPIQPLLGLISLMAPIIVAGNSCVILSSETRPLSALTFGEVLATSDVPNGVVNILSGFRSELMDTACRHLDINALALDSFELDRLQQARELASENIKRVRHFDSDWHDVRSRSPYLIRDFCETKTTWHPIEQISESGSGY